MSGCCPGCKVVLIRCFSGTTVNIEVPPCFCYWSFHVSKHFGFLILKNDKRGREDGQTGHNMQQLLVCCCNMGHLLSLQHASEDDQTTSQNIQMMQNLLVNVKQMFCAHYSFTTQPLCISYILYLLLHL